MFCECFSCVVLMNSVYICNCKVNDATILNKFRRKKTHSMLGVVHICFPESLKGDICTHECEFPVVEV